MTETVSLNKAKLGNIDHGNPLSTFKIDAGDHTCSFTPTISNRDYKIGNACEASISHGHYCTVVKGLPWNTQTGTYEGLFYVVQTDRQRYDALNPFNDERGLASAFDASKVST
jgi:hypothetical protein